MGKTKSQSKPKVQRIAKQALLSPYFSYFETMPSNQSKHFVNSVLPQIIVSLKNHLELTAADHDCEPPTKRLKVDEKQVKYAQVVAATRCLQKHQVLAVG